MVQNSVSTKGNIMEFSFPCKYQFPSLEVASVPRVLYSFAEIFYTHTLNIFLRV